MRRVTSGLLLFAIMLLTVILYCNHAVKSQTAAYIYKSVADLPVMKTALVPGTSEKLRSGSDNPYFENRIAATVQLYNHHKISYIVVSGDNRSTGYNEPADMKRALMLRGIPKEKIYTDYAGLRTFDSVVRCKAIFGQDSIIVVSQRFQNERAVFIANHKGIYALAFDAKDVSFSFGIQVQLRELLARVAVFTDLFLLQTQPHHLGNKILIAG